MKDGLLRAIVTMIALVSGVRVVAEGIINTFLYDIFAGCVDGTYEANSFVCQSGPATLTNVLAAVLFFAAAFVVFSTGKVTRRALTRYGLSSLLLLALLVGSWQLQKSLQDNFLIYGGPETFNEYLYIGYVRLNAALVGIVIGFAWWLPNKIDKTTIPASKRKEAKLIIKPRSAK